MAIDKKTIPKDVFENFSSGKSCFFIGAGLSMSAGFPSWEGLMVKLIKEVENLPWYDKSKVVEYKSLVKDPSKFLFLAEDIKGELGTKFYDLMGEWFGKPDVKPMDSHKLLVKIPSSIILTINYDRLIENAFNEVHKYFPRVYSYNESREAANFFWKNEFFIFKAHGDASKNPTGLILSQKDYRKTLYRENGYRSLLQAIFTTKSIFFIGVSLSDPEFMLLMDYLHDSYHGGGPTHYLLMEDTKVPKTLIRRYLEDFKIHTITYKNDSGNHSEVTEFLKIVASGV